MREQHNYLGSQNGEAERKPGSNVIARAALNARDWITFHFPPRWVTPETQALIEEITPEKIIDWFVSLQAENGFGFHGTSSRVLDSIKEHGLNSSYSGRSGVDRSISYFYISHPKDRYIEQAKSRERSDPQKAKEWARILMSRFEQAVGYALVSPIHSGEDAVVIPFAISDKIHRNSRYNKDFHGETTYVFGVDEVPPQLLLPAYTRHTHETTDAFSKRIVREMVTAITPDTLKAMQQ